MLKVAFVACNRNRKRFREDPSYIYRCENLANALRRLGHDVALVHLNTLPLRARFDVVVFHRPRFSWRFQALLALLRRKGTQLVADFDDLVFDEALASFSPGVANGLVPLKTTRTLFRAHHNALTRFGLVTVSTAPLADDVRRRFPNMQVSVIPNAVHSSWIDLKDPPVPVDERKQVLTYSPGTRSHDRDFSLISGVLSRLLEQHPALRLVVTGPLNFSLKGRAEQVVHHEKLPFEEYYQHVRQGWVNLAPLEQTPFTRCKSALKVIEAGYWNIPTVCSPLSDSTRFRGAGALLAGNEEEWFAVLNRLVCDPVYYREQAVGLRDRILERADIHRIAGDWLATVTAAPRPAEGNP